MLKLVLDTNILISACWTPTGLESRVVALGLSGECALYATTAIWQEYEEVLRRPKFQALQTRVDALLADLRPRLQWVEPQPAAAQTSDPDDQILLDCATAAQADWLITGNLQHFPSETASTRIGNARQFLESFDSVLL